MNTENPDNETITIAENFLAIDGMQETVINLLMPSILDELKKVGIDKRPTNTNTNGVDPIQFPTPEPQPQQPRPQQPQPVPQQKVQMDQILGLLQAFAPYLKNLGPLLGLAPATDNNPDSFERGMKIFSQYDAIKESGKREYVELISTLTQNLTNRTNRDPAEVMGQIAKTELNNENDPSK